MPGDLEPVYGAEHSSEVKSDFAPESTAILGDYWHHVEYYLPDYPCLPFEVGSKWEQDEGRPIGSPEARLVSPAGLFGPQQDEQDQMVVVIFDPILEPFNATPERARMLPLAYSGRLSYLTLDIDEVFDYGDGLFEIVTRQRWRLCRARGKERCAMRKHRGFYWLLLRSLSWQSERELALPGYLIAGFVGFIGWKVSKFLLAVGHTAVSVDNLNDAYDAGPGQWRPEQSEDRPGFDFWGLASGSPNQTSCWRFG
jgi:hypothetical protein